MHPRRTFLKRSTLAFFGLNTLELERQTLPSLSDLARAKSGDTVFQLIRQSLLLPDGLVYLNTGSLGPATRQVVNAVTTAMHELESNPVVNNWGALGQQMEAVRQKVADFIHATEEEIILTRNTTEGINLVASCLDLQAGDEILTTDHEHGGGENGLFYLAETRGAIVKKIAMPLAAESPEQIVKLIRESITDRTRVIMLSHVSTITGLRMPLTEIAAITRPRNILLIADGAQAPGQIRVDVQALGVDVYAGSGHKWLMGPKETGFVYFRKGIQESIQPVFTRGSRKAYSAASGTRNVATIIGLGKSLDLQQTIGPEKIEDRCRQLANYCAHQLRNQKGLKIISPSDPSLATGIVSVLLDEGISNRSIFEKMREENVIIKLLPKYNALRFSLHLFNTEADVDRMVTLLGKFMKA